MQPETAPPGRRTLIVLASIVGVLALLAAGGLAAYLSGVFDEQKRFGAVPAVCPTLVPGLHLLGTGYGTAAGTGSTCNVTLPGTGTPMMTVSYSVGASPDAVSAQLRDRAAATFHEVDGLGDEGFSNGRLTVFRVGNLLVGIAVLADIGSTTDAQIKVFENDLATRLADA
jgi:hypothetical protein